LIVAEVVYLLASLAAGYVSASNSADLSPGRASCKRSRAMRRRRVVTAVTNEIGVVVSRQQVQCCDPEKAAGSALSKRWSDLFFATREAFLHDAAAIPIGHRSFRLRGLQRMYEQASERGKAALAAALLEQAAKEVGGIFTNRRELSGPAGGPIRAESVHSLSDAELERIAAGVVRPY